MTSKPKNLFCAKKPFVVVTIYDSEEDVLHRTDYEMNDLEEAEIFSELISRTHHEQFRRESGGMTTEEAIAAL